MPNESLIALIKRAAMDAYTASKPCNTCVGKVIGVSPLKVAVGQKIVLSADFLDITETAHQRIKSGSRVLLLRQAGGQKYTVVDTLK